jgi:hypothetical protein
LLSTIKKRNISKQKKKDVEYYIKITVEFLIISCKILVAKDKMASMPIEPALVTG